MFQLEGRTALVTGSSRGIGRAILLAFAGQGANVILHGRAPSERAEQTIAEAKKYGGTVSAFYADMSLPDGPERLYRDVEAAGLQVDILVLNASVEFRKHWTEISQGDFEHQINVNFRAPFQTAQRFIPEMQKRGWGRVITLGSVQQIRPHEEMLIYSACKSALYNMVLSLAPQLAPYGVTINNLAPGAIHTDRNDAALSDPAYKAHVESLIPVRYIGQPEDIAGLAVYLASEESSYLTGENIFIAGGKDL